jgi:hypothetical protein
MQSSGNQPPVGGPEPSAAYTHDMHGVSRGRVEKASAIVRARARSGTAARHRRVARGLHHSSSSQRLYCTCRRPRRPAQVGPRGTARPRIAPRRPMKAQRPSGSRVPLASLPAASRRSPFSGPEQGVVPARIKARAVHRMPRRRRLLLEQNDPDYRVRRLRGGTFRSHRARRPPTGIEKGLVLRLAKHYCYTNYFD